MNGRKALGLLEAGYFFSFSFKSRLILNPFDIQNNSAVKVPLFY